MEEYVAERAEKIMRGLEFPEKFKRCFENIFRTKRFANEYFTCVGCSPFACLHSLSFGNLYLCLYPLFTCIADMLFEEEFPGPDLNSSYKRYPLAVYADMGNG